MNHVESSVKIYYTKDYNLFTNIKGNRKLNQTKISSIVDDILNGTNLLPYCPILVTQQEKKLRIHDGQHRFSAAVRAGSSVWYVIGEKFTLRQIAKANANTESWKNKDYFNLYITEENENYKILSDFLEKTKFPFSSSLQLLAEGSIGNDHGLGQNKNKLFKKGEFKVKYENAANVFWEIIKLFDRFKGYRNRSFLVAIEVLLTVEKFDLIKLVTIFNNNNPETFKKAGSPEEYISTLTALYNS